MLGPIQTQTATLFDLNQPVGLATVKAVPFGSLFQNVNAFRI